MGSKQSRGGMRWVVLHSRNVRICHWINTIASGYLLLSGIHIFLDFPELYWGHTGYQGYPAIFKLSDWGLSWDEAGALGNRMWGRNYHFTFAWVFLVNGLVYVTWSLWTPHLRDRLWPRLAELSPSVLRADLWEHVPWTAEASTSSRATATRYGSWQKLSYLAILFFFVPMMLVTGIAQSPAFTAAWPWLLELFGGRQTARTLHTIGTLLFVLFVVIHLLEVFAAGAVNRVRSMFTGRLRVE